MNNKLLFIFEFIKLLGRLADAAHRDDTQAYLGLLGLLEKQIKTVKTSLTFRVVDLEWNVDDEDL